MRTLTLILLANLVFTVTLFGQTPISPNLTVGASKVLLDKGSLDAELIGEIIAGKKQEVKTELAKRVILDNLKNSNRAVQRFAMDNFDLLFSKASASTKKKELLRSSAELALVIGFSEYYLQDLKKRIDHSYKSSSDYDSPILDTTHVKKEEYEFALEYLRNLDNETKVKFCETFFNKFNFRKEDHDAFLEIINSLKVKCLDKQNKNTCSDEEILKKYDELSLKNKIYLSLDFYRVRSIVEYKPFEISKNISSDKKAQILSNIDGNNQLSQSFSNYLPKPIYLWKFKNNAPIASEDKDKFTSPNHLLVDLVYNEVSNNELVRQFGFFQRGSESFNLQSKYFDQMESSNDSLANPIKTFYKPIQKIIKKKVDNLLTYYTLIQKIIVLLETDEKKFKKLFEDGGTIESTEIITLVKEVLKTLDNVKMEGGAVFNKDQQKFLNKFFSSISNIPAALNDAKSINDYINYLENEVYPFFVQLNIENGNFKSVYIKTNTLKDMLLALGVFKTVTGIFSKKPEEVIKSEERYGSIDAFQTSLKGENALSVNTELKSVLEQYKPYIDLLESLSSLDNSLTYDKIFKFIAELGKTFSDKKAGIILNSLVNFMDKYAEINDEKNTVSVDLEGITKDLYAQYQENVNSRFSFSFTVGVNTATPWFINGNNNIALLKDSDGNDINNASFVSEKIGIKGNILDWNKKYIEGNRSRKPIINNVHGIVYASGLLYQIDALNTEDQINFTTLGAGVGITFFNNLDFNVSYGGQINDFFRKNYLNIGFDIQITEYLSALAKKTSGSNK